MSLSTLRIRPLVADDPPRIASAFAALGWQKPRSQFERYLREQTNGVRAVLVALVDEGIAGYVTVKWSSSYEPFRRRAIPEVVDLNVLPPFRRRGIASALMDRAEASVAERSPVAGIGVGLDADYGPAQRLYVLRGFIPDGRGVASHGQAVRRDDTIQVDDDLVLYLTKQLRDSGSGRAP